MSERKNGPKRQIGSSQSPWIGTVVEHLDHGHLRDRFFDRQAHMEAVEPMAWAEVLPVRGTRQHWDRGR